METECRRCEAGRPSNIWGLSRLFALVDKADSLLIDEARIPLVIAGSLGGESSSTQRLAGIERLEQALGCGSLHDEKNYSLLTELNCALHAHVLLRRDVDYIVRDGRVEIVDELTGRVVLDRHWPDGLQAAVEAKEGIERHPNGQILGSITLQHFLRGYARLCGMTGTAQDAASALRQTYGLDVVVVPTHRPMVRVDQPDVVFANRDAKKKALVEKIRRVHATRRPALKARTSRSAKPSGRGRGIAASHRHGVPASVASRPRHPGGVAARARATRWWPRPASRPSVEPSRR